LYKGVKLFTFQGARHRHLWVFEHRILPRFLLLEPAPDALPFGHPCAGHHVVGTAVLRMGHPQVGWSLQLMIQDVGKTEQLQGDHEERRGSTT